VPRWIRRPRAPDYGPVIWEPNCRHLDQIRCAGSRRDERASDASRPRRGVGGSKRVGEHRFAVESVSRDFLSPRLSLSLQFPSSRRAECGGDPGDDVRQPRLVPGAQIRV